MRPLEASASRLLAGPATNAQVESIVGNAHGRAEVDPHEVTLKPDKSNKKKSEQAAGATSSASAAGSKPIDSRGAQPAVRGHEARRQAFSLKPADPVVIEASDAQRGRRSAATPPRQPRLPCVRRPGHRRIASTGGFTSRDGKHRPSRQRKPSSSARRRSWSSPSS